jgi:pimeloyl-ACP methyl ester carboxylesterase
MDHRQGSWWPDRYLGRLVTVARAMLIGSCLLSGIWYVQVCPGDDSKPVDRKPVCVVLIGGIDSDPTPEQIAGTAPRGVGQSGMYQLAGDLTKAGISAEYFNWNGSRAGQFHDKPPQSAGIAKYIRDRRREQPGEKIAIVGNSWGGHTAWEVCEALSEPEVPIDLVLFLDPASTGRSKTVRPPRLPKCVQRGRNYHTRNLFGWREWPNEERLDNIDLGDPQHGFRVLGGPKYDSTFDTQAHIAAEWDPKIHREIQERVLELADNSPK